LQTSGKKAHVGPKWFLLGEGSDYVPPNVPFQGEEKLNADLPPNATALDFFRLYLTDEIVNLIVEQTNKYAEQYISSNDIKRHSPVNNWSPTNDKEMIAFLGLCMLIGVVYKPHLPLYWSTDAIYQTDIFPSVMARDRFMLILKFLHFTDNSAQGNSANLNGDRLRKIKEITQLIRNRCRSVYTPGRDLCVDESLLLFKGRLAFKQFIKTKRARFGIKMFDLCTKDGILLDVIVYTGDMSNDLISIPNRDFLMSERIPITLLQPYLNKGYRLFIDNFYTSPRLADFLLDNGTMLVGTVRHNRRDFPDVLAHMQVWSVSGVA